MSIESFQSAETVHEGPHADAATTAALRATVVLHQKIAADENVRAALASLAVTGVEMELHSTAGPGDAVEFAHAAAIAGVDVVVAGGGDGTINEVVTGFMHAREQGHVLPRLAILPLGTANDFARAAGIPLDPVDALRLILEGRTRHVDVANVEDRYFINVATGGFTSEVTAETSPALKQLFGGVAYLLTGLTSPSSVSAKRGRIRGPGCTWEGEFLAVVVGNARQAGGGFILTPAAVIDDGLLDVAVLPASEDLGIVEALKVLMEPGLDPVDEAVLRWRVPWLEVEADEDVCFNLDGEPTRGTFRHFQVVPGALPLVLPLDSPLLSKSGA